MTGIHRKLISRAQTSQLFVSRYFSGCLILVLVTTIDYVWVSVGGYSVHEEGVIGIVRFAMNLIGIAGGLFSLACIRRYAAMTAILRFREAAYTLSWLVLLLCFIASDDLLQYLTVTVNAPLVDESLIRFDNALGFHWLLFYRWVHAHPTLQAALQLAYLSFFVQVLAVPIILGLTGRRSELSEFVLLFMLTGSLLLLISTPIPASSAFLHFGISDPGTASGYSDFNLLRNGKLRVFEMVPSQGLISLPSFHTIVAVLSAYALRHIRKLFPLAVLLNLTMIASTPTQGGHYLADVFAGILLSALTIFIFRRGLRLAPGRIFWGARREDFAVSD
ncbi:phosphatase PAP2 family protein [Paraburkholderia panacisoli]|uniref:Phosphatase PAP2 family protein n=1 Tax=Paraburkholderia panacisoli TaxID=2603818 RepID=A0A5B0HFD4_9BURK|nr:phosphatase PAP2 family protein [Paraburkholderia panacisoli]KAA1013797.1 phosphatase PAP2 family protein [Paraburkholderia panacisoli]